MEKDTYLYSLLRHAWGYNLLQRIFYNSRIDELINEVVDETPNGNLLDVGCGPAKILESSSLAQINYYGVDPNEKYIKSAREHYQYSGKRYFFNSVVTNELVSKFPIFDIIVIKQVLHHLSQIQIDQLFLDLNCVSTTETRFVSVDPCFVENQNSISKCLVSLDRGKYVRHINDYNSISTSLFNQTISIRVESKFPTYDNVVQISRGLKCSK